MGLSFCKLLSSWKYSLYSDVNNCINNMLEKVLENIFREVDCAMLHLKYTLQSPYIKMYFSLSHCYHIKYLKSA